MPLLKIQENTNDYSDELIESISVISEHMTKLHKSKHSNP